MNDPPEHITEALRWLAEADDHLAWARVRSDHQELSPGIACFLAHLATEKALKAALIAAGSPFPKTHNLMELRADIPEPLRSAIEATAAAEINPWAIASGYAADMPEGSDALAVRLVKLASVIVESVRDGLPQAEPT